MLNTVTKSFMWDEGGGSGIFILFVGGRRPEVTV
jgi:hypothetical protein